MAAGCRAQRLGVDSAQTVSVAAARCPWPRTRPGTRRAAGARQDRRVGRRRGTRTASHVTGRAPTAGPRTPRSRARIPRAAASPSSDDRGYGRPASCPPRAAPGPGAHRGGAPGRRPPPGLTSRSIMRDMTRSRDIHEVPLEHPLHVIDGVLERVDRVVRLGLVEAHPVGRRQRIHDARPAAPPRSCTPQQDVDPMRDREPFARVARHDEERARQPPLGEHRQHISMVVVVTVIEGQQHRIRRQRRTARQCRGDRRASPTMVALRDRSSSCAAKVSRSTRPAPTRCGSIVRAHVVVHEHRGADWG